MRKAFLARLKQDIYYLSQEISFKENVSMNKIINNCLESHLLEDFRNLQKPKTKQKKQQKTPYLPRFTNLG